MSRVAPFLRWRPPGVYLFDPRTEAESSGGERSDPPDQHVPLPRPSQPRAVMVILGLIVVIYLFTGLLSGSIFQPDLIVLIIFGAKENSLISSGEYWRLLSATLLHGNLIHIFFNSFALYSLGPESERIYGTGRFLALYILAGLGGSVASYLLSPAPSVGASGAIFGLIGGLGIFFFLNRRALGEFGRAQVQSIVSIAVINLIIGFSAQGIIDNWGHLGGLLVGVVVGAALAPRLIVEPLLFPPIVVRSYPNWGWSAALGVAALLLALVVLLPGA